MAANNIEIGKLRAILGLDTAQYEAGARKAVQTNAQLRNEFAKTRDNLLQFNAVAKKTNFSDMIAGMTQASPNLVASRRLIDGLSASTKQAAAQQLVLANASKAAAFATMRASAQQASAQAELAFANRSFTQRLIGNARDLRTSFAGAGAVLSQMALGLGAGALAIGAFGRSVAAFASHMEDLSAETGIGVERLQQFHFVATGVGLSIDDIVRSVNQLTKRIGTDDDSAVRALADLGIEAKAFEALGADEQLFALADAFGRVDNAAKRTTLSVQLFGRSGPQALRFLNEELRALVEAAPKMDKELIKTLGRFDDMVDQSWIKFRVLAVTAIDFVAKHFQSTMEFMFGEWASLIAGMAGAIPKFFGQQAEVEGMATTAGGRLATPALPKPFGITIGSAEQAELDRRVQDATEKTREAAAERLRIAREAAAELQRIAEANARESESAHKKDLDAMQQLAATRDEGFERRQRQQEDEAEETASARSKDVDANRAFEDEKFRAAKATADAREQLLKDQSEAENADMRQWAEGWTAAQELMRERWERFADDLTFAISNGVADMLVGLRSFRDGFVGIWQDIRRAVANVISQMLAEFIGGFVRPAIAAATGGSIASGVAGGAAGGAGLAGGGAGLLALASNPFTIAAAAGIGLGVAISKGFLRGGEEASQVSPRRDRLIGQFGGWGPMAAQLKSNQLMGALGAADTVGEFELAQGAIVSRFAMMGKTIKSFATGGFIPPGVVQPAILHGGTHGEVVMPLDKAAARGTVVNNYWTISGLDGQDVLRVVKDKIAPALTHMQRFNVDGYTTQQKLALGIR